MEPRAPGIQIREVEVAPPAFLRLGVAGFVGQAERGPLHSPQAVANWGQYTDLFGGFLGHSYLSYAVYGFFLNGGKRCFVARTAHESARAAETTLRDGGGRPAIRVLALNEGVWGEEVEVACDDGGPRAVPGQGFRLIFRHRPGGAVAREEVFPDLWLDPSHPRWFARAVAGQSLLARVEDPGGTHGRPAPVAGVFLENGDDGPRDLPIRYYTGYRDGVTFRPPGASSELLVGLAAFERVSEIGTVAVPDFVVPDLFASTPAERIPEAGVIFADVPLPGGDLTSLAEGQRELLRHCRTMGERFAILDPPPAAEIGRGPRRIED